MRRYPYRQSPTTDLSELPFGEPLTAANPAAPKPRVCRRHSPVLVHFVTDDERGQWHVEQPHVGYQSACEPGMICARCYKRIDAEASRRGRTNRSRGNSIERQVAAQLGLKRVGQYGGPDDARGEMLTVQVKSGAAFPERIWTWLQALPADASQTRAVVLTDAPGPGYRRRAVIVLDLQDWLALHGPSAEVVA